MAAQRSSVQTRPGLLTKGEMTVRRIFGTGRVIEVSGAGYAPEGSLNPASNDSSLNLLLRGGILCNDASLFEEQGKWSIKGDPTEAALVVLAAKAGLGQEETRQQFPRIGEFPFSSDRKRMSTIHKMEDGKKEGFYEGRSGSHPGRMRSSPKRE